MGCKTVSKTKLIERLSLTDGTCLDKSTVHYEFHPINRNTRLVKCMKSRTSASESNKGHTSAMLVAATTLREFGCARLNTLSCSSVLKPECNARGIICGKPRGKLNAKDSQFQVKLEMLASHVGMSSAIASRNRSMSSRPVKNTRISPGTCFNPPLF